MTASTARPRPTVIPGGTALDYFRAAVGSVPDAPALIYFDGMMSYRGLDHASDALAAWLRLSGACAGDRIALYLQNVPAFPIALLAAWKAGMVPVPINPMNREREMAALFADCAPTALICQDTLYERIVGRLANRPRLVVTTSPLDFQDRNDARLLADTQKASTVQPDLLAIIASAGPGPGSLAPEDLAFIVYTSGTTGAPKGSMSTHSAAMSPALGMCEWLDLVPGQPLLGLAPLFHITGLVCQVLGAFALQAPLVLSYRFDAGVMLDAIAEHRPAFSLGAITAYVAMMNHPEARPDSFEPIRHVCSGGAPVPASVAEQFLQRFGKPLLNAFGMTETNAPVIFTPPDQPPRVDAESQALSIGKAMRGVTVTVIGEDGTVLPGGQPGELILATPSLTSGYWNKPEETEAALTPRGLKTGDVGFVDEAGWVFLIDRKKDMISASGYKVWPRDVEDVLYMHPAVREAAVVGIPDEYRGETVKAVVSLKPGHVLEPGELVAFCRERMAAYKYPRVVEVLPDLPKTPTGKIMRRALRDTASPGSSVGEREQPRDQRGPPG